MGSCTDAAVNAFAAWQCQKFYARRQINGACLKAPGGDLGVWQCQQYYTRIAERPAPSSMSSPPPALAPEDGTDLAILSGGSFKGREAIFVGGTFKLHDDEAFVRRALGRRNPVIVLSGPGGSAVAGIRIGQFVRFHGWDTIVPEGESCTSACALAWLGGVHRYMGVSSHVGFHATYRMQEGRAVESGVGNAIVGAYLNSLGLPERAVIYVTQSAPDDMQFLTPSDASALGIRIAIPN